jgi:GT2 family glycosyltransferase
MCSVLANRLKDAGIKALYQTYDPALCAVRRLQGIELVDIHYRHAGSIVNLDGIYENNPNRNKEHIHNMVVNAANAALGLSLTAANCRPRMLVTSQEKEAILPKFVQYPKPWVFVSPMANSWNHKQVPNSVWEVAAPLINGTKFWLGMQQAPPGYVDLQARYLDNVIEWLSIADLFISVDTGPMHIGAALGIPLVAINQSTKVSLWLNDQNDFTEISPSLDCLNCCKLACPRNSFSPPCRELDPQLVATTINTRLESVCGSDISAIVPTYQQEVKILNKCIEAILPQVQEVIVSCEGNGTFPAGAVQHPKIKYVKTGRCNIGYSGNANFGARHARGAFLWFLNDDAFLAPNCVEAVMHEMKPGIGMIGHLLRYPDGRIYHAGKVRNRGDRGWGHIDYGQITPSIKNPCECEDTCGCSVLVRRKAFYDAGGFDEDLPIFANDSAFSLQLRRAGYKVWYTPHGTGIHLESTSIGKVGNKGDLLARDNSACERKWAKYFEHNFNRIPGNFDYLK